jgi:hypothetical protein
MKNLLGTKAGDTASAKATALSKSCPNYQAKLV